MSGVRDLVVESPEEITLVLEFVQQIAGGGGPIFSSPNQITADQTIPAGHNAFSLGPLTINDGVAVVVAPGANWRIL